MTRHSYNNSLFLLGITLALKCGQNLKEIKKTPKNLTALLSFFTLVTASKIINENYYQNKSIEFDSIRR